MKYTFVYGIEPDHKRFQKIGENRDLKPQHIQKIIDSVKNKIDLLGANPIIVANDFIIDGQHRFDACRQMNKPVPYIEIIGMTTDEMMTAMHTLNSNAKNWGLADYLKR
jgi:ParB-like chromosome segregation protein Spo0J